MAKAAVRYFPEGAVPAAGELEVGAIATLRPAQFGGVSWPGGVEVEIAAKPTKNGTVKVKNPVGEEEGSIPVDAIRSVTVPSLVDEDQG